MIIEEFRDLGIEEFQIGFRDARGNLEVFKTRACRRQSNLVLNIEYRSRNIEPQKFLKSKRQNFFTSIFCGSLFCGSAVIKIALINIRHLFFGG
jgi:hypothetical protein